MKIRIIYIAIFATFFISCSTTTRIVLLPDTQTYAEKYPEIMDAQLQWIANNSKNIDFVLQQGDLTQNNNDKEWTLVKNAFTKIDDKVPYVLAVGNHDMGSTPGKFADIRNTTLFNQYFPFTTFSLKEYFGGAFEPGKLDNSYYLINSGRLNFLIITLEFGPRNEVLDWANQIVDKFPEHITIINTHAYMYEDNTRIGAGDKWRPQAYGVGKDTGAQSVNDGEQIWEKLVKKHKNIRLVFSGHILDSGVGTLTSINEKGLPVYQMLANYQEGVKGSIKGGNGYLRIIDMNLSRKTIRVQTYSPYLNKYKSESAHNFILNNVKYK